MSENTKETDKLRWAKSIYRKVEGYFESSASRSLGILQDEIKEDFVKERYIHYRDFNAWVGVIGPVIISVLLTIVSKPDKTEKWFAVIPKIPFYWILIIGVQIICVFVFSMSFLQKNVWENILEVFKEDKYREKDDIIEKLNSEKKELGLENAILKTDVDRLQEFQSVTAYVESKRKNGQVQSISNALIQRVLSSLGPGEFSVSLYHSYNNEYLLDEYETTRIKQENPSSLNKIIKKTDKKYVGFFSNRCLFQKVGGKHCFSTREDIKRELTGNIGDINQYACCNIEIEKAHNILLEIIAYNETFFAYDKLDDDGMNHYFDILFGKYIPLIEMFIWNEDIQAKFKREQA